jgi:hypothetical protein
VTARVIVADYRERMNHTKKISLAPLRWHESFDDARAEARRRGRPILSLRLLGRLDEELSCANSRFFRAMLYPDPTVQRVLENGFVLHWRSVRPVPVVTIDFGDGRSLVRTLTGPVRGEARVGRGPRREGASPRRRRARGRARASARGRAAGAAAAACAAARARAEAIARARRRLTSTA